MTVVEFNEKYRPKKLADIIGQPMAVSQVRAMVEKGIPHAVMLLGPSGVGKTTICKYLARRLKSEGRDFQYINCASQRGIDGIREIESQRSAYAANGGSRLYCFDECHRLTKDAQAALLIMLEEIYDHCYFVFLTTEPQSVLLTLRTRCQPVELKSLASGDAVILLDKVAKLEGKKLHREVRTEIVNRAEGSARQALQLLEKVFRFSTSKEQLEALAGHIEGPKELIELMRLVFNEQKKNGSFGKAMQILRTLEVTDIEEIRRCLLRYAGAVLRNNAQGPKKEAALRMLSAFRDNFNDSGKDGLTLAIWEAMEG